MIFSCVVDYTHAIIIDKNRGNIKSKLALISSIIVNLGLLGFFKYSNFFIDISNNLIGTNFENLNILLPIGISFYTFQTMSYTIDVYKGDAIVQKNILTLSTFVTLFPQLVAGPIVRFVDIQHQLHKREHTFDKFYEGVCRFIFGLSKKVILANNLGLIWTNIKATSYGELSILTSWLGIICFTLQIYFDFSGYSDMAIGLGKIFGFDFLENFNYPYISKSITEFWRRWHMSLGIWFRDYVYIPLGGNRCKNSRWLFNIFVVWFLTGFWHGASVNFIIWGLFFGTLLVIEKLFLLEILKTTPKIINHFYVLICVIISFVFFDIDGVKNSTLYIKSMFSGNLFDEYFLYYLIPNLTLLIFSLIGSTPIIKNLLDKHLKIKTILLIFCMILSTAFLVDASFNPFLYFRF
ncbi:MAG: MBOAT family O-acyltransferase [Peptostreptococcaceae bacterium]